MTKSIRFGISFFLSASILLCMPCFTFAQEDVSVPAPISEVETVPQTEEVATPVPQPQDSEVIVENTEVETNATSSDTVPAFNDSGSTTTDVSILETTDIALNASTTVIDTHARLLALTAASSTANAQLPFALVSEPSFAINGLPEFVFSFDPQNYEASFLSSVTQTVVETIEDLYEGSIVEKIVDTVVETVSGAASAFIDFVMPEEAQGQEVESVEQLDTVVPEEESVQPAPLPAEDIPVIVPSETPIETEAVSSSTDEIPSSAIDADEVETVSATGTDVSQEATTTVSQQVSYALVDGKQVSAVVTHDASQKTFTMLLQPSIFMPGEHALELHLAIDGEVYTAYYIFTVAGTILQEIVISTDQDVLLIANALGEAELWLVTYGPSSDPYSFELIAGSTLLPVNPSFSFIEGTLFWTTALGEAVLGYDIVSKTLFSQTLNTNSTEPDIVETNESTYEVFSVAESLTVEVIPEELIP